MDEFGSPIAGGITAVRRNISSSFLGARQKPQPDTITTDLLQEQSLKLSTVSSNLQNISRQIASLDFSLKSVKDNLAISDQIERQRAAENQKRERILAEQGLREGKESALEQKIQMGLTQPLQKIGVRTQGILGGLTNFLFTLAGGWLTITGIDLLQAMAEGNVDKINRLKTQFLTGLTVLLGSLTAIQIGIKKTIGILGMFAGNVARIAFGGILKAALNGVKILLAGLIRNAALVGAGFLGAGGIGGFVKRTIADLIGLRVFGGIFDKISGKGKIPVTRTGGATMGGRGFTPLKRLKQGTNLKLNPSNFQNRPFRNITKIFNPNAPKITGTPTIDPTATAKTGNIFTRTASSVKKTLFGQGKNVGAMANPTRTGGLFGRAKGLLNRGISAGKSLVDDGVKAVSKTGIVSKAMNLTKGLPKVGLGKFLGRVLGPFITFFSELLSEDGGLMSALSATAGFLAGAKVGAIAGGAIGALFGGVGAAPGAFIGGLIGGFAGESVMKNLSKKIMNALGMKDIKVFNRNKKEGDEVEAAKGDPENITPLKNGNLDAANKISNFDTDKTEVIDMSQNNTTSSGAGGGVVTDKDSRTIPNISFNNDNNYVLAATVNYGV